MFEEENAECSQNWISILWKTWQLDHFMLVNSKPVALNHTHQFQCWNSNKHCGINGSLSKIQNIRDQSSNVIAEFYILFFCMLVVFLSDKSTIALYVGWGQRNSYAFANTRVLHARKVESWAHWADGRCLRFHVGTLEETNWCPFLFHFTWRPSHFCIVFYLSIFLFFFVF